MKLRIVGSAILVAGVALVAFGTYGALRGPASAAMADALVQTFADPEFRYASWLRHWRLWGVGIACAGSAVAIGGAALALGKLWGLILVAVTFLAVALVPWTVQWLDLARYPFERADMLETVAYLAISALAAWSYIRLRRLRTDA